MGLIGPSQNLEHGGPLDFYFYFFFFGGGRVGNMILRGTIGNPKGSFALLPSPQGSATRGFSVWKVGVSWGLGFMGLGFRGLGF